MDLKELLGKVFISVIKECGDSDQLIFTVSENESYMMEHHQDCCEHVYIEDINGDLNDLVGAPILQAEESSWNDASPNSFISDEDDHNDSLNARLHCSSAIRTQNKKTKA